MALSGAAAEQIERERERKRGRCYNSSLFFFFFFGFFRVSEGVSPHRPIFEKPKTRGCCISVCLSVTRAAERDREGPVACLSRSAELLDRSNPREPLINTDRDNRTEPGKKKNKQKLQGISRVEPEIYIISVDARISTSYAHFRVGGRASRAWRSSKSTMQINKNSSLHKSNGSTVV